ncbi:lytic transglycosylase domain-containing protein [Paracoccus sp. IB05]|uniref:lytic transglycosylase domain-containing protein n=1 Tax=Paracoccus sp. IB05 TaxID=2779367 RepID=UPI00351C1245
MFRVALDGQLASVSSDTGFMRQFGDETPERLFLFTTPRDDGGTGASVATPRSASASPEILQGIEDTALRYGGHAALRRAGLSVTDWALFYRANIEVESAYNPAALSHAGAIGLGQLMPDTASFLGVDPNDWRQNLDGSARYLLLMLETFGTPELALAAYNAGPEAVSRHGGIPPYVETQGHVARVQAVYARLKGTS